MAKAAEAKAAEEMIRMMMIGIGMMATGVTKILEAIATLTNRLRGERSTIQEPPQP